MKFSFRTISNGLFLIFLGVVFLLFNYGALDWNFFGSFIDFWPVVLIVIGLGLILNRRFPISFAFLVLGLVMLGMSIFLPPASRPYFWVPPFYNSHNAVTRNFDYSLPQGVNSGGVSIVGGGADISLGATSQGFAQGSITANNGEPSIRYDSGSARLSLALPKNVKFSPNSPDVLDLKLTDKLPLDLDINAGAVSAKMDFSKIKLNNLKLQLGAADVNMIFGQTGQKTKGTIKSGASSITLVVPKDVGLRINFSGALANIDFQGRSDLNKNGNTYTSANFDSAASSVDMDMSVAVSSVRVQAQ